LLMTLWLMVGCDQERSPLSPDQESALAPPAGKGNPHDDDDASAELESDGNTKDKPQPNGKATGNPHLNGDIDAESDGKAKGVNADPSGHAKSKGAAKMLLLEVLTDAEGLPVQYT
jgi:hypothetical protein